MSNDIPREAIETFIKASVEWSRAQGAPEIARWPDDYDEEEQAAAIQIAVAGLTAAAPYIQAPVVAAKNDAYYERNQLVAVLARLFPSGLAKTAIEGWEPCWHNCVYIDSPAGQLSWHFHDDHAHLFAGIPPYRGIWDGHSSDEKYARLAKLTKDHAIISRTGAPFYAAAHDLAEAAYARLVAINPVNPLPYETERVMLVAADDPGNDPLARALLAYRAAKQARITPRERLTALIEEHGGEHQAAIFKYLNDNLREPE